MFIVRKQSIFNRGGASYLVEASKDFDLKYRYSKQRKADAKQFKSKATAQKYATMHGGEAVAI